MFSWIRSNFIDGPFDFYFIYCIKVILFWKTKTVVDFVYVSIVAWNNVFGQKKCLNFAQIGVSNKIASQNNLVLFLTKTIYGI